MKRKRGQESRLVLALKIGALIIGADLLAVLTSKGPKAERKYYKELKTPPWAPPAWVFGPVWTTNNIFLFNALLQLLGKKKKFPDRKLLLGLQGAIWFNFLAFGYVFFRKKSPLLGATITKMDAVAATTSYFVARRSDKKFASNYLPLMVWTWFASTISRYIARHNPDPLFKTKPLIKYGL